MCHACPMANLHDVAEIASQRIGSVAERAKPIARGVALLASACGGLAYLVGALVLHSPFRYIWLVIGLVVCAAPAYAVWKAFTNLRRAAASITAAARDLQELLGDRTVRDALYELADHKDDTASAPLIGLGKDLMPLRSAVSGHRPQLRGLWETISAVTTLPGLLAFGIMGSFGLLILSVVAVLVGLAV